MNRLLIFDTTHHAMWAEEVARAEGLGAEVITAPEGTDAKCGLALEVLPEDFGRLLPALDKQGVPYRVWL
jgi:hypothetical protein